MRLFTGTGEFIRGTGRLDDGFKGSLTFKGKPFTPISIGLKETRGDMVFEGRSYYFTMTLGNAKGNVKSYHGRANIVYMVLEGQRVIVTHHAAVLP